MSVEHKIAELEARIEAINATFANVLSTLVLHGVLTKPTVEQILAEARLMASGPAAASQVDALKESYPAAIREAMGPAPDDDDHDH
jgi:outer membrane murein-binding lipoprotein Lpp